MFTVLRSGSSAHASVSKRRPIEAPILGDLKWFEPKAIYPLIAVRDREEH